MSAGERIPLLLTRPQPCSYLEQLSQSLCLAPDFPLNKQVFSALTAHGFRRSGDFIYRPHCPTCSACIPVRIPVNSFTPNTQQKRTLKRGSQLRVNEQHPRFTDEHYQLYQSYIAQRHADGEMFPASTEQFQSFLVSTQPFARFYEFRLNDELLAVAVSDQLEDGLSAVYSFFAPQDKYFSLGRYAVLWQILHAQQLGLPYLYLGYWISQSRKMNYKTQYQPIQGFINEQWQTLS